MKPLIIYHANCMDGAAAALAAWLKFGEDAEYRPVQYGDPAPTDNEVRGRDVYVLDFSYPRAELEWMDKAILTISPEDYDPAVSSGQLHVLDHHKTAQVDLSGLPFCTFDMNKSGAVLAWEHFAKPSGKCTCCESAEAHDGWFKSTGMRVHVPELFAYVQDRDLWQWKLPHSREVSAALAASGALTDFRKLVPIYNDWADKHSYDLYDGEFKKLIRDGAAILRNDALLIERIVASAEEVTFRRNRCFANHICNHCTDVYALATTSAVLQAEVGEALALESTRRGRDAAGVVYYRDGKTGKWQVSLFSRDYYATTDYTIALDVSAVAKSFGGGGHAKAAGFECEKLPWLT